MDELRTQEYKWYVRGCRKYNWHPLSQAEFASQYDRYRRCNRAVERSELRRVRHLARRGSNYSNYRDDVFLERLIRKIREERDELAYLSRAVFAGSNMEGEEDEGGAGMPAYRRPYLPVLTGAGAKLPPHLDPEPWARDP